MVVNINNHFPCPVPVLISHRVFIEGGLPIKFNDVQFEITSSWNQLKTLFKTIVLLLNAQATKQYILKIVSFLKNGPAMFCPFHHLLSAQVALARCSTEGHRFRLRGNSHLVDGPTTAAWSQELWVSLTGWMLNWNMNHMFHRFLFHMCFYVIPAFCM